MYAFVKFFFLFVCLFVFGLMVIYLHKYINISIQ